VRFVDLLRTTVLLSAGAATALAATCVASGVDGNDRPAVLVMVAWWAVASIVGSRLGHGERATPPIANLLANATAATSLPEPRAFAVIINRLWPLVLSTLAAGALAFLAPQIPGIAAGFAIIWALAWRHQDAAVAAIEERDGVTFFVERTSPFRPIQLVRAPGFRRNRAPTG
jgi:hypothetical protein